MSLGAAPGTGAAAEPGAPQEASAGAGAFVQFAIGGEEYRALAEDFALIVRSTPVQEGPGEAHRAASPPAGSAKRLSASELLARQRARRLRRTESMPWTPPRSRSRSAPRPVRGSPAQTDTPPRQRPPGAEVPFAGTPVQRRSGAEAPLPETPARRCHATEEAPLVGTPARRCIAELPPVETPVRPRRGWGGAAALTPQRLVRAVAPADHSEGSGGKFPEPTALGLEGSSASVDG